MKNNKKTDLTILNFDGIDVELMPDKNNETLWGTADIVAKIFGIDRTGVIRNKHNIFRQIANQAIETYITQGVVINQNRITPEDLAKILRKWRTSEKSIYSIMKDVIKESASDYNIAEKEQKNRFFSLARDKFLFAITNKTFFT